MIHHTMHDTPPLRAVVSFIMIHYRSTVKLFYRAPFASR
jgi:hypothetical protein